MPYLSYSAGKYNSITPKVGYQLNRFSTWRNKINNEVKSQVEGQQNKNNYIYILDIQT